MDLVEATRGSERPSAPFRGLDRSIAYGRLFGALPIGGGRIGLLNTSSSFGTRVLNPAIVRITRP